MKFITKIAVGTAIVFTLSSSAFADVAAGLEALESRDLPKAAEQFNAAFEAGDGDGAFYLGRMAEFGVGLPADLPRAAALYKVAAEKGSVRAMNRLGLMHLNGNGALQNYAKALELICGAAEEGDANAQFNCGNLYAQGKGADKNLNKAVDFYRLASQQDHIAGTNFLALATLGGSGTNQSEGESFKLFDKTAKLGNPLGLYQAGAMLADGKGTDKDLIKSHMYLNLAASRGHPSAAQLRSTIEGQMSQKEIEKAQSDAANWTADTSAPEDKKKKKGFFGR